MKRAITSLAVSLAVACLAVVVYAGAGAPKAEPLTGTWQCTSHGGSQGGMAFTLSLQQSGENISGSVSSPLGDADISSASFKDNSLRIVIDGGDTQYVLTAKYSDGKLTGDWKTDSGEKGTWEGKRAPQPSK
jgi:hypothetical protein